MYNLLYYSKNFRKTRGSFWNYYPDKPKSGEIVPAGAAANEREKKYFFLIIYLLLLISLMVMMLKNYYTIKKLK